MFWILNAFHTIQYIHRLVKYIDIAYCIDLRLSEHIVLRKASALPMRYPVVWFSHGKLAKFRSRLDLSGTQTRPRTPCSSTTMLRVRAPVYISVLREGLLALWRKAVDSWRTDRPTVREGAPPGSAGAEKREHEFKCVHTHSSLYVYIIYTHIIYIGHIAMWRVYIYT